MRSVVSTEVRGGQCCWTELAAAAAAATAPRPAAQPLSAAARRFFALQRPPRRRRKSLASASASSARARSASVALSGAPPLSSRGDEKACPSSISPFGFELFSVSFICLRFATPCEGARGWTRSRSCASMPAKEAMFPHSRLWCQNSSSGVALAYRRHRSPHITSVFAAASSTVRSSALSRRNVPRVCGSRRRAALGSRLTAAASARPTLIPRSQCAADIALVQRARTAKSSVGEAARYEVPNGSSR